MNLKNIKISIVVPVYNGSGSLKELTERCILVVNSHFNNESEIILVDDYSKDNSWQTVLEIKSNYPEIIKAIRLTRNFGQHNATLCGFHHSKNQYIITIDDDLEFKPEDIVLLVEEMMKSNSDMVYGVDNLKKYNIVTKSFVSLYKKVAGLVHGKNYVPGSSFRLLKRELALDVLTNASHFSFIDEFVSWHTTRISSVSINCEISKRGKSRYSFLSLIKIFLGLIFISSTIPLKVVKFIGVTLASINFIIGIWIIIKKMFMNITVSGYASIIVSVLFSSGIIILILAIIAEYISNLLSIAYKQPAFKESEIK
jgi:glycosyltransferase involved in cell wall biosynthesis